MKRTLLVFCLAAATLSAKDKIHYQYALDPKPNCGEEWCRNQWKYLKKHVRYAQQAERAQQKEQAAYPMIYPPIIPASPPQLPTYNIQLYTDQNGYSWGQIYPSYYYPLPGPFAPVVGPTGYTTAFPAIQ